MKLLCIMYVILLDLKKMAFTVVISICQSQLKKMVRLLKTDRNLCGLFVILSCLLNKGSSSTLLIHLLVYASSPSRFQAYCLMEQTKVGMTCQTSYYLLEA